MLYENLVTAAIGLVLGATTGGVLLSFSDRCNDSAYHHALSLATEAVEIGRQAPSASPTDALGQWMQAEALWTQALTSLEEVEECSEFFDGTQERLSSYATNRELVQQEIVKLSDS